jgi:hypothetical protein
MRKRLVTRLLLIIIRAAVRVAGFAAKRLDMEQVHLVFYPRAPLRPSDLSRTIVAPFVAEDK